MIVGGETGMLLPSGEREKEMQKNVESQTIGFGEIWDFRIVPLPAAGIQPLLPDVSTEKQWNLNHGPDQTTRFVC